MPPGDLVTLFAEAADDSAPAADALMVGVGLGSPESNPWAHSWHSILCGASTV